MDYASETSAKATHRAAGKPGYQIENKGDNLVPNGASARLDAPLEPMRAPEDALPAARGSRKTGRPKLGGMKPSPRLIPQMRKPDGCEAGVSWLGGGSFLHLSLSFVSLHSSC
jgi:hypothetical protein